MHAEIRKRERLGNGWYRYFGIVDGQTKVNGKDIGVRLPASYVESVSEAEADAEVKEALCGEYDRLSRNAPVGDAALEGGAYAR